MADDLTTPGNRDDERLIKRAGRLLAALAADLSAAEKARARGEQGVFHLADRAARALEALQELETLPALLDAQRARARELREAADTMKRRAHAAIPAALAALLDGAGHSLEGTLPELRFGLLTLRFRMEAKKPQVEILYGPGIATLLRVPVDAARVAEAVRRILDGLARPPLDEEVFLRQLRQACRLARLRQGADDDRKPAPIVAVMAEVAFARQNLSFQADPVREAFASYGRVTFSYDLFRLRRRELDGETLVLGVASREQTKRPENHLWVPTDDRGRGAHFADVAFRRRS